MERFYFLIIVTIVIGVWGTISIIGNIIKEIAYIKATNNPLSTLFGGRKNNEEDK